MDGGWIDVTIERRPLRNNGIWFGDCFYHSLRSTSHPFAVDERGREVSICKCNDPKLWSRRKCTHTLDFFFIIIIFFLRRPPGKDEPTELSVLHLDSCLSNRRLALGGHLTTGSGSTEPSVCVTSSVRSGCFLLFALLGEQFSVLLVAFVVM